MNQFFSIQRDLLELLEPRERFLSHHIAWNDRCIGIVWPRGVGKSTLLLQYLKKQNLQTSLYVSLDHTYFYDQDLFSFVEKFVREYSGSCIILDEVHRYPDWSRVIKNLYDSFPRLQILFSGSSSIDLIGGNADLSRRAVLYRLSGSTFREFLLFDKKIELPSFTLEELFQKNRELPYDPNMLSYFREYLEYGYYPYLYDVSPETRTMRVRETIEKTLYEDVASFYNLMSSHIFLLKKLLVYIASIPPWTMSINKLAKTLEIDHKTVSSYIEMLAKWGLIRYLKRDAHGYNILKNTEKIYPDNPTLALALSRDTTDSNIRWTLRELFVMLHADIGNHAIAYSSQGDMSLDDQYILEIGWKNKKTTQIHNIRNSFILADDLLVRTQPRYIPLWALWLLK